MKVSNFIKKSIQRDSRGDTIIEVLLALAVMSFALGASYRLANENIQKGIAARERIDAISLIESQIAELKVRQEGSSDAYFDANFNVVSQNFCLYDDVYGSDKPLKEGDNNWAPIPSTDPRCAVNLNGVTYRMNIATQYVPGYPAGVNSNINEPIVYKVTATWDKLGNGGPDTNVSTVYYRF